MSYPRGVRRFTAVNIDRMMNGKRRPTENEMAEFVGERAKGAWVRVRRFLRDNYDIVPEMLFDRKRGWGVRYRKGGKTLITLTPEKGGVGVLMVLGGRESEEALSSDTKLSHKMRKLIENTKQLHDGRWLWISLSTITEAEDIERLLPIKRRPRKRARQLGSRDRSQ